MPGLHELSRIMSVVAFWPRQLVVYCPFLRTSRHGALGFVSRLRNGFLKVCTGTAWVSLPWFLELGFPIGQPIEIVNLESSRLACPWELWSLQIITLSAHVLTSVLYLPFSVNELFCSWFLPVSNGNSTFSDGTLHCKITWDSDSCLLGEDIQLPPH